MTEYKEWLRFALEQGVTPTHYFAYSVARRMNTRLYIANEDVEVPPLTGVYTAYIIEPSGITVKTSGHNEVYSYNDPTKANIIPVFTNMDEDILDDSKVRERIRRDIGRRGGR